MTFDGILPLLREGKRARRAFWQPPIQAAWLELVTPPPFPDGRQLVPLLLIWSSRTGTFMPWGGVHLDILAGDWEIIE